MLPQHLLLDGVELCSPVVLGPPRRLPLLRQRVHVQHVKKRCVLQDRLQVLPQGHGGLGTHRAGVVRELLLELLPPTR